MLACVSGGGRGEKGLALFVPVFAENNIKTGLHYRRKRRVHTNIEKRKRQHRAQNILIVVLVLMLAWKPISR